MQPLIERIRLLIRHPYAAAVAVVVGAVLVIALATSWWEPAFWGVLVGSGFSLGGVFLTNRFNQERTREQFAHDRVLRADVSERELRKQIYLEAAEVVPAAIYYIAKYSDPESKPRDLQAEYQQRAPALAKLHLVAGLPVAETALRFGNKTASLMLTLATERFPLDDLGAQIQFLASLNDDIQRRQDQIVQAMRDYNQSMANDPPRWKVLEREFAQQSHMRDHYQRIREELQALHGDRLCELLRNAVASTRELSLDGIELILAMRQELGLPTDRENYLAIVQAGQDDAASVFERFLARLGELRAEMKERGWNIPPPDLPPQ